MKSNVSDALAELTSAFGGRVSTEAETLARHASRTTWIAPEQPDAVLAVANEDETRRAVVICARHACPIVAFGAGTSFEGSVNAPRGGLSLDLNGMNSIIAINDADFDCVVEPGIRRLALAEKLRPRGLFFAVDPGSDPSLGGMASTRSSGTNAGRFGSMRENVLAMRVVLPNGEVISTARRVRKSAAGYDLTRLFIGAEGTLGIITQLTLKLAPLPPFTTAALCGFPSVEAACSAFTLAAGAGVAPARVELLDEAQVIASNRYSNMTLEPVPTLFLEFNGTEAGAAEQARRFGEVVQCAGGTAFRWAASAEERSNLWKARNDAFWATQNLRPEAQILVTDVCLPISRLGECIAATKHDIDETGLLAPIVAHVGDGNFHTLVLVDTKDPTEVTRAHAFADRLVTRALAMEGTCTGEHGIGQGKRKYLEEEYDPAAIVLMGALKHAIDPSNIMNPDKILMQ